VYIPIRTFALSAFIQFLTYFVFYAFEVGVEQRQFIARLSVITMNMALSIIIIAARMGKNAS